MRGRGGVTEQVDKNGVHGTSKDFSRSNGYGFSDSRTSRRRVLGNSFRSDIYDRACHAAVIVVASRREPKWNRC